MSIRFFMLILIIIPNLFLACANTESKTIKEETIVEVIKEYYLDKTDRSGRFVAVTVKFLKKLKKPVALK